MLIDQRYEIIRLLGEGGMGAVYHAHDRLTATAVALKRVSVPVGDLIFNSRSDYQETAVALTQEFRMLASLRHPNIINVLDYGFAHNGGGTPHPYFTMQLLQDAKTITDFAHADRDTQIDLLLQTLEALRYLHRLNVIHRDLKPGNILVMDRQVKVLDFGLAIDKPTAEGTVGTLAYMAPEALRGQPITAAADLYAFGVVMYELLAGEYPYPMGSMHSLLSAITQDMPDIDTLDLPDGLQTVLYRLLDKQPANRYANAFEAIRAICDALGRDLPTETIAIRESFLQAAKFVGREVEVSQLMDAYANAGLGEGSVWLIGGESGIGKSRLLQEIRAQTLVKGAVVLEGQAISEGGTPYQMWGPIVRQLILRSQLSDLEAGILRAIIPDIDRLLERDIPPIDPLDGQPERDRLFNTVVRLFERQSRPLVVLLEDIQWASTDLLRRVIAVAPRNSLLLIATYRDDDAPDLPEQLKGTHHIKLQRLSPDETAALTLTMIGNAALDEPRLLQRIQHETEGNVFFLVEVMRVLAEEAGSLDRIGRESLPSRIFAGGIARIVQRRLESIPPDGQALLQLAAVLGRMIEPDVLTTATHQHPDLAPATSTDAWIASCVAAAVFSAEGERIRFAHDKLREHLLADLPDAPSLHQRAARALEATYPDRAPYAERLLHHWQQTGDEDRIYAYAVMVGDYYHERGEAATAAAPYQLAYDIVIGRGERPAHNLALRFANALRLQAEYDAALTILDDHLATDLSLAERQETLIEKVIVYADRGQIERALALEPDLAALTDALATDAARLKFLAAMIRADFRAKQLASAMQRVDEAYQLAEKLNRPDAITSLRFDRAQILFNLGEVAAAQAIMREIAPLFEAQGDYTQLLSAYTELGIYAGRSGNYQESLGFYRRALDMARRGGLVVGQLNLLVNTGVSTKNTGDYRQAIAYYDEAMALATRYNVAYAFPYIHNNRALAENLLGDYPAAIQSVKAAYRTAIETDFVAMVGHLYAAMADIALNAGDLAAATDFLAMTYTKTTEEKQSIIEADRLLPRLLAHISEADFEAAKARVAPLTREERGARLMAYRLPTE